MSSGKVGRDPLTPTPPPTLLKTGGLPRTFLGTGGGNPTGTSGRETGTPLQSAPPLPGLQGEWSVRRRVLSSQHLPLETEDRLFVQAESRRCLSAGNRKREFRFDINASLWWLESPRLAAPPPPPAPRTTCTDRRNKAYTLTYARRGKNKSLPWGGELARFSPLKCFEAT